ncbi:MAG: hypothetical protein AAFR17_12685 [Pseudomonadota bacterium]
MDYDFWEMVAGLLGYVFRGPINLLGTFFLLVTLGYFAWASIWPVRVVAIGGLAVYIVVATGSFIDSRQFYAWKAHHAAQPNPELPLPNSLWIDPGRCEEYDCRLTYQSYRSTWKRNQAIPSLLFKGGLDFVDFGHDQIIRFRPAAFDPRCWEEDGLRIPIAEDSSSFLETYSYALGICALGAPVAKSSAERIARSRFVRHDFNPKGLIHHLTVRNAVDDGLLAEAVFGNDWRITFPPMLDIVSVKGRDGIWARRFMREIAIPEVTYDLGKIWWHHRGLGTPSTDAMFARYGIRNDLLLRALRSGHREAVRRTILFSCGRSFWSLARRGPVEYRVDQTVIDEIQAIAKDPGREGHHLARRKTQSSGPCTP